MDNFDEIKYLAIYLDNSCEVHFNSLENAKIFLSPCGSEFVYRIYDIHDNTIQSIFYFIYKLIRMLIIF